MRGRVAGMLLWTAATAGATLLVQGGVGTIRAATRSSTVVDVQAVAVEVDAPVSATAAPTTRPPETTTPPTSASAPTATVATSPGAPAAPGTTTRSAATAPAGTTPPAPPVPATPVDAPPTTAPPTTAASVTRTIATRGGSATIRFRPDEVTVIAATPNAGYAVKVERNDARRVRVEFESSDARSRIEAWWDTEARYEVREDD